MTIKIQCPICATPCDWDGNRWRPFCSQRCQLIDLGAWMDEEYKVGHEPADSEVEKEAEGY